MGQLLRAVQHHPDLQHQHAGAHFYTAVLAASEPLPHACMQIPFSYAAVFGTTVCSHQVVCPSPGASSRAATLAQKVLLVKDPISAQHFRVGFMLLQLHNGWLCDMVDKFLYQF